MPVILNKWIEKERKVRSHDVQSNAESTHFDSWLPVDPSKVVTRYTKCLKSTFIHTLRGLRK